MEPLPHRNDASRMGFESAHMWIKPLQLVPIFIPFLFIYYLRIKFLRKPNQHMKCIILDFYILCWNKSPATPHWPCLVFQHKAVLEDNCTIIDMVNTTWNIVETSIVMEYAMRNIIGTLIVSEIQALFRPAGGGGIKRQWTLVWATFLWNKIVLEGWKNPNKYLSLACRSQLYSCSKNQFDIITFFVSSGFIFKNLRWKMLYHFYMKNCCFEKYSIVWKCRILFSKKYLVVW